VAVVVIVGAAHLVVAERPRREPSKVIFPPQELPLRFSHAVHVGQLEISCEFCHDQAPSSQSSVDNLMPTEAACRSCHAIDRSRPGKEVAAGAPPARCDACHVGFEQGRVARVTIPPPNLKFSHKRHVDQGQSCISCHGDLAGEGVGLATRMQLPRMEQCLDCHNRKRGLRACTTCHLAEAGARMRTDYPNGALVPSGSLRGDAHDLAFRSNHRAAAQADAGYCENCHQQTFCTDCHNGVVKPMDFHVGDYIALHSIDARRDQGQCGSCHRLQTFCTGCHARSGVSADARVSEFGADNPLGVGPHYHPPGWAAFDGRTASHHAFEAQRNIRTCASCHREEDCLDCHSRQTGSAGINPHPRGWAGSWRCKSLQQRAGRMCQRCHVDPSELSCAPFASRR